MHDAAGRTTALATLGGGCFWCLDAVYRELNGVVSVTSGYAGGDTPAPTYREVCSGMTGHNEVVLVVFDPPGLALEAKDPRGFAEFLKQLAEDPWTQIQAISSEGTFEVTHTEEEWLAILGPEAYEVMRNQGTEYPWTSALLDGVNATAYALMQACGLVDDHLEACVARSTASGARGPAA